ncbi:DUF5326 family protein [Streptomyces carpaticus]|uniref:Uncharacterized protein n=2 Tax=Streptomyces TaxID=1883 RepID=A0A1I6T3C7_9ACTN|nr:MULTISPECIES: DUF5326 family protein [Streptomyces]MCK1817497.1 DUF5326 family protein [Streptomyces sp. XM4011]QKV69720.1 DUF5326 family protein [Streptomyces harbinensis]UWM50119.1 DUF5326 family protein [Streptomyces carpaticus]SFS83686.1 hypothetical protein SAMN05444716_104351 [Streptomyces harbinensis]
MRELFRSLPWWVRWVAIPAIVLVVFGGLITSVLTWVMSLMFKILVCAALIALLIFLVRKFTASSSSGGGW